MLKHMVTSECPRECAYCIVRNIALDQNMNMGALAHLYKAFAVRGHDKIMLTGGEPTIAEEFLYIYRLARLYFKEVHITTQNVRVLDIDENVRYDGVTFSLHDINLVGKVVLAKSPIYGAMMDFQFKPIYMANLAKNGWSGMTVNEDQRGSTPFSYPAKAYNFVRNKWPDFSMRINKKGHCMDETIILPDFDICNDFRDYL